MRNKRKYQQQTALRLQFSNHFLLTQRPIGEVQHISSYIQLRNQRPMRLLENSILTNQIQIKNL